MNMIEGFRQFLIDNLNSFVAEVQSADIELAEFTGNNIVIDDIDTDKYQYEVMIYIIPEEWEYQKDTLESDVVTQNLSLLLFVRKDNSVNLAKKVFLYNDAIKMMFRAYQNLNGMVDQCNLLSQTYYQGVEGIKDIKGMEYNISLVYQENY